MGFRGLGGSLSSLHVSDGFPSIAVWRNRQSCASVLSEVVDWMCWWWFAHPTAPPPCCDAYRFVFSSRRVRAVAVGPSTASQPWWAPVYPAGTHGCALMPKMASSQSANPCWCVACVVVVKSHQTVIVLSNTTSGCTLPQQHCGPQLC